MSADATTSRPRFGTVALLFVTACLSQVREGWAPSPYELLLLAIGLALQFVRITAPLFAAFLCVALYGLIAHWPATNDPDLMRFCFVIVFLGSLAWHRAHAESAVRAIAPLTRWFVVIIYFYAGFHKLNSAFLNPSVSCSSWLLGQILWLFSGRAIELPSALLRLAAAGVVFSEIAGSLCLLIPALQGFAVFEFLLLHVVLAFGGFQSFGCLMIFGMFAFLSEEGWRSLTGATAWRERTGVPWVIHAYSGLQLAGALLGVGLSAAGAASLRGIFLVQSTLSVAGYLVLLAPLLPEVRRRRRVFGAPMGFASLAWPARLVAAAWIVLGLTPYLGLNTKNNFTMFSNLSTEGREGNHLLLGANPLKLWRAQDDLVWIEALDPRVDKSSSKATLRESLAGKGLPVTEFRNRIYYWKARGLREVSATFTYGGRKYASADITADPDWSRASLGFLDYLQFYKPVQRDAGADNRCGLF